MNDRPVFELRRVSSVEVSCWYFDVPRDASPGSCWFPASAAWKVSTDGQSRRVAAVHSTRPFSLLRQCDLNHHGEVVRDFLGDCVRYLNVAKSGPYSGRAPNLV